MALKERKSILNVVSEQAEQNELFPRKFEAKEDEIVAVVVFEKRPLGLDVESGTDGRNLYVTESDKNRIKSGSLVVQINDTVVRDKQAPDIVEVIQKCKVPIQICFVTPRPTGRGRGLSLRLRNSILSQTPGVARIYLPNGNAYALEIEDFTLEQLVVKACQNNALTADKVVLLLQHREKENDIQHPDLTMLAATSIRKNVDYRMRLIPKSKAESYQKGVPIDGVSILSKNDFDDNEIEQINKFLAGLRKLEVDAAYAQFLEAIRTDFGNKEMGEEEIKAVLEWHRNKSRGSILAAPKKNFMRIWFEDGPLKNKTYAINDPNITAADLCAILSKDRKVRDADDYALHICGYSDLRSFEQELNPDDRPNQVRDAIKESGVFGQIKFVFKEIVSESSGSEDSDSDEIEDAPTQKAFRIGSIDAWSSKEIEKLRTQMAEQMEEMKRQATEFEEAKSSEDDELQKELEAKRLELVKECVINQYQLAEVIHDFDANTIENFPDYKALQDLHVGHVIIVTENDPSGWSKGKNINGGPEAYFPTSYVDVVAQPEMLVEAIHDFDPESVPNLPAQLVIVDLQVGDQILVTGTHISGWWRGCKVKGGPEGYFPGDYTKVLAQPAVDPVDTFRLHWGQPVMDGHVSLRIGMLKRFQNKYCYLTPKAELLYFNNLQSDPKEPQGRFDLWEQKARPEIKKLKKFRWELKIAKTTHVFKSIDDNDVDNWIQAIEGLLDRHYKSL